MASTESRSKNVKIVGAGPIGLLYAIAIKKISSDAHIEVYEKRQSYQRKHNLYVNVKHLRSFIKNTGLSRNQTMHKNIFELLDRIESDKHIPTSELQQSLENCASSLGVTITKDEEINQDTIQEKMDTADFFIGADGTHSTTSKLLFNENNIDREEIDFVMQVRFTIEPMDAINQSTKKPPNMRIRELAQIMLEHENIMQEFIGSPSDQDTTQGTMQFMLTKEQYEELESWTSKNPYKYLENNLSNSVNPPTNVMALVDHYLYKKHKQLVQSGFKFDIGSISLSVNEAPVTRAKEFLKREYAKSIMLVGDASLGLSYFKGLNAGIEAASKWVQLVNKKDLFSDSWHKDYQCWFRRFQKNKKKEVRKYSHYRVKLPKVSVAVAGSSMTKHTRPYNINILKTTDQNYYTYRDYDPLSPYDFYIPIQHSFKKAKKVWVDLFQPYKTGKGILNSLLIPFEGISVLLRGIGKMTTAQALYGFSFKEFQSGAGMALWGITYVVATPFALATMPFRIARTASFGWKKYSENRGFKQLINLYKSEKNENTKKIIAEDLYRKVIKYSKNRQLTLEENVTQPSKADDLDQWVNSVMAL